MKLATKLLPVVISAVLIPVIVTSLSDAAQENKNEALSGDEQSKQSVAQSPSKKTIEQSARLGRSIGRQLHRMTSPRYRTELLLSASKPMKAIPGTLKTGVFATVDEKEGEVCRKEPDGGTLFGTTLTAFCRKRSEEGSRIRALIQLSVGTDKPHKDSLLQGIKYTREVRNTVIEDGNPRALVGWRANDLKISDLSIDERLIEVTVVDSYSRGEQKAYHRVRLRHALMKRIKPGIRAHYRAAYNWLASSDYYNFEHLTENSVKPDCSDCPWSRERYSVLPASTIASRFSKQALAIEVHELPDQIKQVEDRLSFEELNLDHKQYLPHYRGGTYRLIFDTLEG